MNNSPITQNLARSPMARERLEQRLVLRSLTHPGKGPRPPRPATNEIPPDDPAGKSPGRKTRTRRPLRVTQITLDLDRRLEQMLPAYMSGPNKLRMRIHYVIDQWIQIQERIHEQRALRQAAASQRKNR